LSKRLLPILLLCALPLFGQSNWGELRLKVIDPTGLAVRAPVQITSEANGYRNVLVTNDQGELDVQRMPYGVYQITIKQSGFADASESVQIRSSLPIDQTIQLKLSSAAESVTVTAVDTLINPDQAGSVSQIGSDFIQDRLASIPGRSLQDLVNSQPGWLYEGNAVLHPRGSEYQTQFVVDGIPLTDNRSPSFGPEIPADDVESMTIYTAGIPAEYGRKMGGVVELNTAEDSQPGLHGQVVLSGGNFDTAGAFAEAQYGWGLNTLSVSASGGMSDHYLNPVVIQNYTNTGTVGDFSARYQRDLTPKDRLTLSVRHELSRYLLPNEQVQQTWCYLPGQTTGPPCQVQNADNFETMGIVGYTHTFSPSMVADFHGMVRDNWNDFYSNPLSTPIEITQHNWFREGYFRGNVTINHGRHDIKAGVESDNIFLHENFAYNITDDSQYDPSTPLTFSFKAQRPDLEQAVYVQDLVHVGNWTVNAGLRWDIYQLLVNNQAVSPRIAISRYFPSANLVLHFSYDRIFQTPSFENILLSSSTAAAGLDTISLQLPVRPSVGDYYEAGLTKVFWNNVNLGINYYRRLVNNYADDDQIDNTTISYPIAFLKAIIYGAEGKITLAPTHGFSGFVSYSYQLGNAWFPVTGGLFLGDDAILPTSGHLPDSQDQRNFVRGRFRYQVSRRLWVAGGIQFDSGLPFDPNCPNPNSPSECAAYELPTYGAATISRLNFVRDRILPSFQVTASAGADIYQNDRMKMRLQVDGQNLTNVVEVIDFGGLFSGNAIGPSRSVMVRLQTTF
jgi:TonB-dependent Receptor Plug Domain